VLIAIWSVADDGENRLCALCESGLWFLRPLHGGPGALTFRKCEIVAHCNLIAVSDHRRARQREHQAVGKLEPAAIALQHWRKTTADPTVIELHFLVGAERVEHIRSLRGGEPAEIQLVVITQEVAPLGRSWPGARILHGFHQ